MTDTNSTGTASGNTAPTRLSILMPVFNEAATVEHAIADAIAARFPIPHELVVVDDGSSDGTEQILDATAWPETVSIHRHSTNRGKGAAVRTALAHARGDVTAILDADLEYRAADIGPLLALLLDGKANVAFGSRAFEGHTSHSFLYVMGNRGVTLAANVLFNVYLKDMMACHKVIRTDLFRALDLRSSGFAIEPEITAKLLRCGERIYELPVDYVARSTAEGKKLTARDGLRVLATLLHCRFAR